VSYNAAGQVISAQVKNGKLESYIGYNANNFAWYNPVNGKMELFMYAKNGQLFMREAFINEAWLNSVVVTEYIKSGDYVPGKDGFLIDGKTSNIEMNKGIFRGELDIGTNKTGAHTVITNERIAVYGDKGEIRVEIGRILGR
ncbi:phage tail tip fiber protein, partial [Proteus mirabilis]